MKSRMRALALALARTASREALQLRSRRVSLTTLHTTEVFIVLVNDTTCLHEIQTLM